MGMEFLQLSLDVEKRFGIEMPDDPWGAYLASRQPPDMTAGEVCRVVEQWLAPRRRQRSAAPPPLPAPASPSAAGPAPAAAPVLPYADATTDRDLPDDLWPVVQLLICGVASVAAKHVTPGTLLVRDLGFG